MFESIFFAAIIWLELDNEFTWSFGNEVSSYVLIAMGMTTNNNWVDPSWHKLRYILQNDGFSENGSIKNISNSPIR